MTARSPDDPTTPDPTTPDPTTPDPTTPDPTTEHLDRDSVARQIIDTALAMGTEGINKGTSGNVSARWGDSMLVTPSSVPYPELTPADIVAMPLEPDTNNGAGDEAAPTYEAAEGRRPSSEWRFHHDILVARKDANAVVHAHPIAATALAIHDKGIGPFHYMVGVAGGHDIRCAPYATFGTPELSAHVVEALADRKACLLAHHGIVAIGKDLDQALAMAIEVEVLAAQYLAACALGEPPNLTDQQMDEVLAKMNAGPGYGSA